MGTNYYWINNVCKHCNKGSEKIHIGKSSYGWCFSINTVPEYSINSLADWVQRWETPHSIIKDEYGETITPAEMLSIITNREGVADFNKPYPQPTAFARELNINGYNDWDTFHANNHSEPGLKGLLRHVPDGQHCIRQGSGTYDYMSGYFR